MKKKICKILIPVVIAVLCGFMSGKYVYKTYKDNLYSSLNSSKLYFIERGEYDDINIMREDNSRNNYVYYKDNDKYKSVVGITKDYSNIDKIKSLYSDKLYVMEYYLPNDTIDIKQDEYEERLENASSMEDIREAVDDILNLYRNDDTIRLIGLN